MRTDQDALNRALEERVRNQVPFERWGTFSQRDYCGSLDAAVAALNALGLEWSKSDGEPPKIYVIWRKPSSESCTAWAVDHSPAALATALVRAALEVLNQEEVRDADR